MQKLLGFLFVSLMAATFMPGVASAVVTAEPELTTSHAQSNKFMSALPQENDPVVVAVSFELRDINHIDDETETVEFTGVLKLSWHDPRQVFDPVTEGAEEKVCQGLSRDDVFDSDCSGYAQDCSSGCKIN